MSNFVEELCTRIQNFLREKINLVIFLLILTLGFNVYGFIKIKKKIDHRYFNTTTTIEQVHNVDVNTYNGELKPKIKS